MQDGGEQIACVGLIAFLSPASCAQKAHNASPMTCTRFKKIDHLRGQEKLSFTEVRVCRGSNSQRAMRASPNQHAHMHMCILAPSAQQILSTYSQVLRRSEQCLETLLCQVLGNYVGPSCQALPGGCTTVSPCSSTP